VTALLWSLWAAAQDRCAPEPAQVAYDRGYAAQQAQQTNEALFAYLECLRLDPSCVPCQYEIGWTYYAREEWGDAVSAWERTLALQPAHPDAARWLAEARVHFAGGEVALSPSGLRVPIGTTSTPPGAPVSLTLVARFQNYNPSTTDGRDRYDRDVESPKSARFLPDGSRLYVNSLEGARTLVYDAHDLVKIGVIEHAFREGAASLFRGEDSVFGYPYNRAPPGEQPNEFLGKPVESELSHGRWLWLPYYRRSWDIGGTSPSAVAVVDTRLDRIVRVLPTGPIPKYVAASPDGRWVAVTHWGDNTLGIVDTRAGEPDSFVYLPDRLVVEEALPQENLGNLDRDAACGLCLRGTVFTPDSRTLLVARMGGGGIAGFSAPHGRRRSFAYLGTIGGEPPTPRHLVISPDGEWLYVSSNRAGSVSRIPLDWVIEALHAAGGGQIELDAWHSVYVGSGARTIELSPDGRWLFAAVNDSAEVVVVDTASLEVVSRVRTDSYAVGLAVSPDGRRLVTTSQGKGGQGGNSVCVFELTVR
jgi:6-phosphogluconolactonase (cycloisomerase 2 family)